jgi:hypothetical protein
VIFALGFIRAIAAATATTPAASFFAAAASFFAWKRFPARLVDLEIRVVRGCALSPRC